MLSITLKWHTCTINFSNTFIQAKLDAPVWIHLPCGFKSEHGYKKTCLCLKKSLYGLSVAPRLWSQHLLSALKKEGFIASKYDSCLLIKLNMLIVLYVDDAGVCAKNEHDIDELICRLTKRGFELTREGSFSEFLGIKFVHDKETGTITATQQGLIKKILVATSMEDCNPNWVPAAPTANFFWSHVKDGDIEVLRVDTDLQDADYMTKGLPHQPFESNCFRTQGW